MVASYLILAVAAVALTLSLVGLAQQFGEQHQARLVPVRARRETRRG